MKRLQRKYFVKNYKWTVLLLLLFVSGISMGQNHLGLDDKLYNGRYYTYFVSPDVSGNQFLKTKKYEEGSVFLQGHEYSNLQLNYDVYNQEVVMKFKTTEGVKRLISLSFAYLDSFRLYNGLFWVKHYANNDVKIFKVLHEGDFSFNIHYTKNLELESAIGDVNYYFTKLRKHIFFRTRQGALINAQTKRKFLKIFNKKQAGQIRHFLRLQKIKYSKMNEAEYISLLHYLNQI